MTCPVSNNGSAAIGELPSAKQRHFSSGPLAQSGNGDLIGVDDLIVPIRTSPGLPSLFLFHTLSGSTFSYTELARRMEDEFSVYGIQAVGFDGQRQPYSCMEAMARHYAARLREHPEVAKGPVVLGGFSYGGTLALETAAHFREAGGKVSCVVLIDSHKSPPQWARRDLTDTELFFSFVVEIELMLGKEVVISSTELLSVGHLQQCILLEKSLGPEFAGLISPLLRVFKANVRAQAQYAVKPYDGRILYLRATATPVEVMDPGCGLMGKVPIAIEKEIAADHFKMLSGPAVSLVAATISDTLLRQNKV